MPSTATLAETSKYLSYILRHAPESIGLALDREGWVALDDLLAAAAGAGRHLSRDVVLEVIATSDKKRFTLSPDGRLVRAAQGHSTASVAITHVPKAPPARLYHGTATRFLEAIRAQGLTPRSRHHVHLSPDRDTAAAVGTRHGKLVVLVVDAAAMQARGHAFYQADNGVWLTASVPPEFLAPEADEAPARNDTPGNTRDDTR